MKLGFRGGFFFIIVILVAVVISGAFLASELRLQLESEADSELLQAANAARELIQASLRENSADSLDNLADRLGEITSARVTVIAADGTVLGDSELSGKQILEADNHGNLPEVQEAFSTGQGRRQSRSLENSILYVAIPFQYENALGVVRIAKPLHEEAPALARFRLLLFHAAILGVGITALPGIFIFNLMSGQLRNLLDSAKALVEGRAEGQSSRTIPIFSKNELGKLAGSIRFMSQELERLMSKLAWERDRFEAVLEGMGEGVLALDDNRHITHINPAALSLLELSDGPTGSMLSEVIRSPDLNTLVSKPEVSETDTVEFELQGKNLRCLQARVTPQRSTGGRVVVIRDVTELRRLEAVRQDFIASISHELRTPASIIQANAETLMESALEGRPCALAFIEAMQRNSERLSSIITDLLDISQIETGKYIIKPSAIRIEDDIHRSLESMQVKAAAKRLAFETEVEPDLLVLADERAMNQILFNLIDNAVKYTPEGGNIVIRACRKDNKTRIEVCDNGYGIELKHHERIFERFYRIDAGRSREMGGTGLGLSIVKNLTEAMGGQVGLRQGRPRGSVFWITLPQGGKSLKKGTATKSDEEH